MHYSISSADIAYCVIILLRLIKEHDKQTKKHNNEQPEHILEKAVGLYHELLPAYISDRDDIALGVFQLSFIIALEGSHL